MRAATLLLIFTILGFVFLYAPIVSLIAMALFTGRDEVRRA